MVTTKYFKSLFQKVNIKKAVVIDSMPPKLVKLTAQLLCQPLTEAENMCIKQTIFQTILKLLLSFTWTKENQINMICQILDQSASQRLFRRSTNK